MLKKILCGSAFVCWISLLNAQFSHSAVHDEKSGLSDNHVIGITQDPFGYIWIATRSGLNRYDGSETKVFLPESGNPQSLMHPQANTMIIRDTIMWIGSDYGISRMDLRNYKIENFQLSPAGIMDTLDLASPIIPEVRRLLLQDNILWITTENFGLFKYDSKKHTVTVKKFSLYFHEIPDAHSAPALDNILSIIQDVKNDSIIWIGTTGALVRYNKIYDQHSFFINRDPDPNQQDIKNIYRNLCQLSDGRILYNTWTSGMYVFNPETESYGALPLKDPSDKFYFNRGVSRLKLKNPDEVWIRTGMGLITYSVREESVISAWFNDFEKGLEYSADFVDSEGRIWGAAGFGVRIYDPLFQQFTILNYKHINSEDSWGFARSVVLHSNQKTLTVFPQDGIGIFHLNLENNTWFRTTPPREILEESVNFNAMEIAMHEKFGWVVNTMMDLFIFHPETFTTSKFPVQIPRDRKRINSIAWDNFDRLWIASGTEGLLYWDPVRNEVNTIDYQGNDKLEEGEDLRMSGLFQDSQGNMWFSIAGGFAVYESEADTFHEFLYAENPEHSILTCRNFVEDTAGRVWTVGSNGELGYGQVSEPGKGMLQVFSLFGKGQAKSYVNNILADKKGKIWVLTDHHLYQVEPGESRRLFSFDYTPFNEEFFSFQMLSDGRFVLGLRNEIALFEPDDLTVNSIDAKPYIDEIQIKDRVVHGNFINPPDRLNLKYNENFISFSFSSINFTLGDKNRYRYRLTPFEDYWTESDDRKYVNYTNIPSGEYSFQLQASNNEGKWNENIYTLDLSIATPWWETWWFRTLLLLSLLAAGYILYTYRINTIKRREQLKTSFEKKLANVELSALRAQMNPHFIFNCLSSIENFIIKNDQVKATEYINGFARLIRLILQNSRSTFVNLKDEIETLELYLQMESLRFGKKIQYQITVDDSVNISDYDIPPMLIQPYVENALWHGLMHKQDGGLLKIDLKRENGILHCTVEDNGVGRVKSQEYNRNKRRSGQKSVGMKITQDRISSINELYNLDTSVQITDLYDEKGNALGTRVDLMIPV